MGPTRGIPQVCSAPGGCRCQTRGQLRLLLLHPREPKLMRSVRILQSITIHSEVCTSTQDRPISPRNPLGVVRTRTYKACVECPCVYRSAYKKNVRHEPDSSGMLLGMTGTGLRRLQIIRRGKYLLPGFMHGGFNFSQPQVQ